ncbi:NLR family CARD domain-containing protein 3-like [Acropora muricata]|uniref:NLR family CARD domain-containing protein 3-like n=1 Tax=Acropora muricata TaxID=159855 RepID=UPI0034E5EDF2
MKRGLIKGNKHKQPAGLDESVSFKPGTLSEEDVLIIAHELGPSWKMFGRVLKVQKAEIDRIHVNESDVTEKCYCVLRRWQEIYPQDATYHRLARALQHPAVGRKDLAVKYCGLQLGTSSEPEITEGREPKGNNLKGIQGDCTKFAESSVSVGLSSCVPPKRKSEIEKNKTEQPAAPTSSPSRIIEWIRKVCQKCEGVIVPVPWCEEFSFHIKNIFTRLKIVEKEKTRGKPKAVTSMTSIFTPHDGCEQPVIVLIEGEPGMGKTTYCQKLVYDWARKQCREWDESFPRIDVLLLLRCREIKSGNLWNAIEDQILPKGIEPEERKMFFQFLKENPSKVLLVLDGLDEADPQKLEMYVELVQKKELPGCYIVLTSRQEGGSRVRKYTDTLLEIVGFTPTDADSYITKYFKQDKAHLAQKLISKFRSDKELRELTQNPLNTLLLCVIFEDLEGVLPNNRTQLYMEIVVLILRRYESKKGLSSRGKDLLLVYKKELMILGRTALDSLRKQELYFDDHKGDIKESLLMKFGFLSIQSGVSKRAPCDRYGFFHKSFQDFFSGYFLAFSIIDGVANSQSVLTDPRYMGDLFQVFRFMSAIIAKESVETAESVVKRIASILNKTGLTTDKLGLYLTVAHYFIIECKTFSGDLDTKLACTFGESLELVDVVLRLPRFHRLWYIGTFLKALAVNSTMTNLELCEHTLSTENIFLLTEALRVNTSLSSLDLRSNSIRAEGANSLAQALRVNTSLSSLNLRSNSIRAEGANSLAQALRVNTSLSSLDLRSNYLRDEGANSLAQALRVNTSLSSLDLRSNSISDEGANSLAQALRVNTSLSSLNLCDNSIRIEGANSVAQALRVNTSLSSLGLQANSIRDEGANSLAQALRVNTSLSSLNLCSNSIGTEGANSLALALRVNTSLSSFNLSFNSIGDEGANSLAQALRVNTSLLSFNLSYNCIGDEGANSLAQALSVNTSLSSLYMSHDLLSVDVGYYFALARWVKTSFGDEGANPLDQD